MVPFILWLILWLVFRSLGMLDISLFTTWQDSARYAFTGMFLFTGITHFTKMRKDYIQMVPEILPAAKQLVYITGFCQLLGAIAILLPGLKSPAGWGLILLLIAMTPANIYASQKQISFRGHTPTSLWLRIPIQLIWIGILVWSTQL